MQKTFTEKTRSPNAKELHKKRNEIMNVENTKAQMRKGGVLEYCILSILNGKDKYASEILQTLKDAKMLVVEGTIYPLLTDWKMRDYWAIDGKSLPLAHQENTTP